MFHLRCTVYTSILKTSAYLKSLHTEILFSFRYYGRKRESDSDSDFDMDHDRDYKSTAATPR